MKQSRKGDSYFEKTFGQKSKPDSTPSEKESGKKGWRNKADFSEPAPRRGKNEVAAPKERAPKAFTDKKSFAGTKKFDDPKNSRRRFEGPREAGSDRNEEARKPYAERKSFDRKESSERKPFNSERAPRANKDFSDRPERKSFDRKDNSERKPFNSERAPRVNKDFSDRPERKSFDRKDSTERKPFNSDRSPRANKDFSDRPERKSFDRKDSTERKPFNSERAPRANKDFSDRPERKSFDRKDSTERKPFNSERAPRANKDFSDRPERKSFDRTEERRSVPAKKSGGFKGEEPLSLHADNEVVREKIGAGKGKHTPIADSPLTEAMPLNKYVAHCGICSRRDAVELIRQGKVKVNGELVTEPGHKVEDGSEITVSGKKVTPQKDLTYVLLNKPKGFITTTEDERGRRTVMDLVSDSGALRLYPIGRLDRNTTGLILLTNDGELSQRLSHPKYQIKKVYHVTLDKAISSEDFEKVLAGVELEDGVAPVDALSMLEERNELGIEIHSGKNRIVRRIFEHLGYEVVKLDRVVYAGLTKKNLPRGKWRKLTEREVIFLKHFKH
jgi:23S rRNA pseudouridine2605 synthase